MGELNKIIEKCIGGDMPFCQAACPLHVDMKSANALIRDGKFDEALKLIREKLPFPGVIGRICTRPCEDVCKRREVDEPISIMCLKRSAADYGIENDWDLTIDEEKEGKIAIIGSGPAGLMAAYELRKMGYKVTIFEALPLLGGMLAIGIPEYRLPGDILRQELGIIEKMGIQIKLNSRIGNGTKISDLRRDFDAIFIATGTQLSGKLKIKGSELEGVLWGVDFLREVNLGRRFNMKGKVIVIGGGNLAIDAARTAARLGAKKVEILYRRSRAEMPAGTDEVEEALREGINIIFLATPAEISREGGQLRLTCTRVELGEPDASGRRRYMPIKESRFSMYCDSIIAAIGQTPDTSFLEENKEIHLSKSGYISVNETTLETSVPGIFAGGDAVTGPKSVIDALAAGKKAAISIDRYIRGEDLTIGREGEGAVESRLKVDVEGVAKKKRVSKPTLSVDQRKGNFQEVELGLSKEEAKEEAERCLNCECKLCVKDCQFLELYCQTPKELAEKFKAGYFKENPIIPYSCNLCELCKKLCPEDLCAGDMCLEMREKMVAEGIGPLPEHELVRVDQEWSTSDAFALCKPDSKDGKGEWVFFPGCSLSAYSPELVIKVYDYLKERLPGTGIILNCCGAPTHSLGEHHRFDEMVKRLETEVKKLGASGVLLACPECYRTIKRNAPGLKVKSIYEVMAESGLPEGAEASAAHTFSLHDSCTVRDESEFMNSVRDLVKKMGYQIEEMEYSRDKTRCCGVGGMVPYVNLELYLKLVEQRANEAPFDMLTYCATCREAFASVGKPSIHVLDLIFNPNWQYDLHKPSQMGKARQEKQAELKRLLTRD